MNISQCKNIKTTLAATAAVILIAPTAQAEIGIGADVSVGGSDGVSVGADVSVGGTSSSPGGTSGTGASADVSIGGTDSGTGSTSGTGATADVSVGGTGSSTGSTGGTGVTAGVSVGGTDSSTGSTGGTGTGAGVSVGNTGSSTGGTTGGATQGTGTASPTVAARAGLSEGANGAAKASVDITALVGAPVWSRDRVLIGMIEGVKPGPNGKVDTVVRLNKALNAGKDLVRMRVMPQLSAKGALLISYSKQQFVRLFAG